MSPQRTYWHLEGQRRVPSEYEITSSRLLYYDARRGFEVTTPVQDWYRRHQVESPFQVADWESFRDPAELTYARYVEAAKDREIFVDGLLSSSESSGYDRGLGPAWLRTLDSLLPVLRFPCHGLHMVSSYLGQLAPASRLVIAFLFQSADEIRRIQRIAYRQHQLRAVRADFGDHSRAAWQLEPAWQPLRRVVETLLVTYDFGEAFVALNLVLKPMFDHVFTEALARLAEKNADPVLGRLLLSLGEDCRRQQQLNFELVRFAIGARAENRGFLREAIARWDAPARAALLAFEEPFRGLGVGFAAELERVCQSSWDAMGIETS